MYSKPVKLFLTFSLTLEEHLKSGIVSMAWPAMTDNCRAKAYQCMCIN